ncbi:AAA family ATP:ADP antiporter [Luteimonas cucumeris]|uniref:AAA family ATP:ADP antiporter n=1 Tax=Luteimonas cucumeris TaxID=985012 RepID=A0A562L0L4_9GAMM|nr:MFS transporter [Luteimonas cucumeris]TWI01014.1 AAA family ATP:ADP antiporter [Luteimonas cucumeris]
MLRRWLTRLFNLESEEAGAVTAGFLMFFLLFAGYFMLRPVRETMGITGGVDNLQWLFTGTFVATLAAMPLFGWVAARVRRRRILYWVFGFFALNLTAFAFGFLAQPDNVWLARTFYIWISVFNMIAISVAWSVLVDLFAVGQAKRLFGLMAAGASLGGLTGPLLAVLLVERIGHAGLLFLSAVFLLAAAGAARRVQHWRDAHPLSAEETLQRQRPLGGSPFAGATEVLRSPFMLGIAAFVLLLASVTTFLYFEQARLVELNFPDKADQTRVFGTIDAIVQSLAILSQLFITGRLAQRLGVGVLLVAVPVVAMFGFLWLAFAPTFAVLAIVMVVRRAGEYAFVRPGREMLWTAVTPEAKYKAKNFVDTVVYRGADAVSAWVKSGVDLLAQQPAVAALLGAALALLWAFNGGVLARMHRRLT